MIAAITAAAKFLKICPALLYAICSTENSKLRPSKINYDDGGANSVGLCQIKVGTAAMFNKGVTEKALLDPYVNAYFAGQYLAKQIKRYPKSKHCAIAAYNAGRCKKNVTGRIKNRRYVKKVIKVYNHFNTRRLFQDIKSCQRID